MTAVEPSLESAKPPRRAFRPRAAVLWPGVLVLLASAFAIIPLARGELFLYWDNAQQHYAQTLFLQRGLEAGRIPQWWPDVGAGLPTVAEGQSAHYHPIRVLMAALFAAPVAFMGEIAIYLVVAGLSTYAFLRRFRLRRPACFVGAVCQMFGSYSVVAVRNIALHRGLFLLPLAMLLADRFVTSRRLVDVLLASLVFGMQLLAGHPVFAVVTVIATSTYVLCRVWQRAWCRGTALGTATREGAMVLAQWTGGAVLGAGIAAVQAFPTLLHTGLSVRQGGFSFDYATELAAKATHLPQLVLPYFYRQGDWLDTPAPWGSYFNDVPHSGIYLGALAAVFAVLSLWWHRRGPAPGAALVTCGAVALALALGAETPLFPAFWSLPAMSGLRYPSRFLMWAGFCLACLAALGFHRVLARGRIARKRGRASPLVVMAGVSLALGAVMWGQIPDAYDVAVARDFRTGLVISLAWFGAALCLVWALLMVRPAWRQVLIITAVVFACADLMFFRARSDYAAPHSAHEVLAPPPIAHLLASDSDRFRVMSLVSLEAGLNRNDDLREFLQANVTSYWGIDSADVFCSLLLKRYYALHEGIIWELANTQEAAEHLASFLGALNVKYVVAPTQVKLKGWANVFSTARASTWKNPLFGPRAFLVGELVQERIEVRPDRFPKATYQRLQRYREMVATADWATRHEDAQILDNIMTGSLDYQTTAVVAGDQIPMLPGLAPGAHVRELPPQIDQMRFEVSSDQPALLVVASNYYPGWVATVNGRPSPIYRTNFVTMGVFVPAGSSKVTLRFATPGMALGSAISACALAVVGVGLVLARRRPPG